MFCLKCGAELSEGARFCKACGAEAMPPDARTAGDAAKSDSTAHLPNAYSAPTQAMGQQGVPANSAPTQAMGQLGGFVGSDPTQVMGYDQGSYYQPPEPMEPPTASFGAAQGFNQASYGQSAHGAPKSGKEAKRAAKAEMKEAKAAYKQARKNAGKSGGGKVVGVVVVILLLVALAAGATWLFMGHDLFGFSLSGSTSSSSAASSTEADTAASSAESGETAATSASSASAETSSSSVTDSGKTTAGDTAATTSGSSASSSGPAGGLSSYIGTWHGTFDEQTKMNGIYHCYGAEKVPMEFTITDVGNSGRVTASVKLLYHAHDRMEKADAASTDGDTVIEVKDLVGTMDDRGSFEMAAELPNGMGDLKLKVSTVDQANGTRQLKVRAESHSMASSWFTDSYTLVKE